MFTGKNWSVLKSKIFHQPPNFPPSLTKLNITSDELRSKKKKNIKHKTQIKKQSLGNKGFRLKNVITYEGYSMELRLKKCWKIINFNIYDIQFNVASEI